MGKKTKNEVIEVPINKKGLSSMVFKLMFVAVAGAIILMFFVRFGLQQRETFERVGVRELGFNLLDQLEAFGVSGEASKKINFLDDVDINIECDTLKIGDFEKKFNYLIFSPERLEGREISAFTKTWEFPFKIANFYYLSNEGRAYILIFDDKSLNFVNKFEFPNNFNIQKVHIKNFNLNQIKKSFGSDVNFIFFTNPKDAVNIKRAFQFSKIIKADIQNNKLKFYHPEESESFYLGDEMLYGAVFSENYECVKDKAIEKMSMITDIYIQKADLMTSKTLKEDCKSRLFEIKNSLKIFKTLDNEKALYEGMKNLEIQNKNLKKNECPTLF